MPENINDLYIVNKVFVFFKKMNIIPEDINDLLLTNIEIIIFVYFYF